MDAIDRAWSEASCFGRSSGAVDAPGSGTRHCLAAASTSMLHHSPLDTSPTTGRLTRHLVGPVLAALRAWDPVVGLVVDSYQGCSEGLHALAR